MRRPVLLDTYGFFLWGRSGSALMAYGDYLKSEQTSV
jgi:hypothetical protein